MTRGGAGALALLLLAGTANAAVLGEADVRSFLGEPLDARIPVTPSAGETLRGACFSATQPAGNGLPVLTDLELSLQRSARGMVLRVQSRAPLDEPAVRFAIEVACAGATAQAPREYAVLVDPRVRPVLARVSPTITLSAREGDTLASIANAIFSRDAAARARYLQALREANPALAQKGDNAPIPPNAAVALPDLRTYSGSSRAARRAAGAPSQASSPTAAPAPIESARPALRPAPVSTPRAITSAPIATDSPEPARPARAAKAEAARASPRAAPRTMRADPSFQLKLSSGEIDLAPSRHINDRERAQLRERLAMLDADDQVAAMLSLRNSLKQLEARVAELQLKLSQMPPTLQRGEAVPPSSSRPDVSTAAPAKAAATPASPVVTAPVATTPLHTPAPEPTPAPPPAATASAPVIAAPVPAVPAPSAPAPTAEAPASTASTPPPSAPVPAPAPTPSTQAPSPPPTASSSPPSSTPPPVDMPRVARPHATVASSDGSLPWLWIGAAASVLILAFIWLLLRARSRGVDTDLDWAPDGDAPPRVSDEIAPVALPGPAEEEQPFEVGEARALASDADLPTRLGAASESELRQRYIEERFPEIATGMIELSKPDSVIKAARLFYEDGAIPRAVELLQFALEAHPDQMRYWLALFEVYRLERLSGEFGALALRFHHQFGDSDAWRKVQYFGREIDPGNELYKEPPVNSLETIGPRESRRLAAGASFDPAAENWLNAPMDFENEVLANELRQGLMQKAGLAEEDLAPNPMPALRHIEMFTVA